MAKQGLLAQSKPAAATSSLLYSAPIDKSASTVLTIANDGTGSAFTVALKDYDQKLTLDANTYLLHEGDVISNYSLGFDLDFGVADVPTFGQQFTTADGEKKFKFESVYIDPVTTIYVKDVELRQIDIESTSGDFAVGDTITTGSSPDDTTAVVYGVDVAATFILVGPSTINGAGLEFADGNTITSTSGGAGTISVSGVGTASSEFVFSTTTAGGTYAFYTTGLEIESLEFFDDRTYSFDVSDSSMTGRDFKISSTENGEWGPDGIAGTGDDGAEYTTNKTTNGTAGSAGAYVRYNFAGSNVPETMYFYDGGTGTASNATYGGVDRFLTRSQAYSYSGFYIYDLEGSLSNGVDTIQINNIDFTITSQNSGAYGYVRDFTGTTLKFIKGTDSPDFSGTDTFRDVPRDNGAQRSIATVSSVDVATTASEAENNIITGSNSANDVTRVTSLVVGPGERLVVESTTQNNAFSLVGFEDSGTLDIRIFGQS